MIDKACPRCGGAGRVRWQGSIEVTVPAGVHDGQTLRLEGEGEPGDPGAPRGDLFIHLQVQEHPIYQRHGPDLVMQWAVTPAQAALGAKINIPLLDARTAVLKVEPGTQSGQIYSLRGEGIKRLRGTGKGDLLVQIIVRVPKKLTSEQERLYKAMLELEGTNGDPHKKGFFDRLKGKFAE